jgi:aminoglycoside phosphotransferase (APT) family kinase protein
VIGKLYRSRRRARRAYERMKALRSTAPGGCSVPSIPRCLLSVRPLGLFFQEWVDGTELDHIVAADGGAAPLELAAQWLLRLHASPAPEGLTVVSRDRTLEKVDAWCETAAAQLPESATRLGRARASFRKRAAGTPSAVGALVHKDYYHAQVLWDGTRIWVLDFDELSLGDPALDVGHFLAHLEYKAYLKTGSEQGYRASTALFAARYADHAPPDLGERLPLYKAYTFLKLAHTEVVRRRDSWRPRARVLIELALRELGARAYGVALRGTRSSGAPGATWE